MKKKFVLLSILSLLFSFQLRKSVMTSDPYLRSKVFKLVKEKGGSCSGEQVKGPSGKDYILTAGHCLVLAENGRITAVSEEGIKQKVRVIKEDRHSDLLLLEGFKDVSGFDIADSVRRDDKVITMTHGKGFQSYRSEGVIVDTVDINIPVPMDVCPDMPKYKNLSVEVLPGMSLDICVLSVPETASTAFTAPGSSGGAIVNTSGKLVGVVSAGGEGFSMFVTLKDIQKFMEKR